MRAAGNDYERIVAAAGDPPPEWRSPEECFADVYRGPTVPLAWRRRFAELNNLNVDANYLDSVLDSSIEPIAAKPDLSIMERTFCNVLKQLGACGEAGARLASGFTASLERADGLADTSRFRRRLALLRRRVANLLDRNRLHEDIPHLLANLSAALGDAERLRQLIADAQAKALSQPRVLAPIAADPLRESRDDFLTRAANHWNSRAEQLDQILRESGEIVKTPMPRPDAERHMSWLIDYQLRGESFSSIAAGRIRVSAKTVSAEVHRLARLLDLRLRPGRPPGRPRETRRLG